MKQTELRVGILNGIILSAFSLQDIKKDNFMVGMKIHFLNPMIDLILQRYMVE